MTADRRATGPSRDAEPTGIARASRGFVLVFFGALMFFAFVIGSELGGSVAQASLSFLFASAALLYLWFRLGSATRHRLTRQARRFVRLSSKG